MHAFKELVNSLDMEVKVLEYDTVHDESINILRGLSSWYHLYTLELIINGESFKFQYRQGSAHTAEPNNYDILFCLLRDASLSENFDEFLNETAFDETLGHNIELQVKNPNTETRRKSFRELLIEAKKSFAACNKTRKFLKKVLGKRYEQFQETSNEY